MDDDTIDGGPPGGPPDGAPAVPPPPGPAPTTPTPPPPPAGISTPPPTSEPPTSEPPAPAPPAPGPIAAPPPLPPPAVAPPPPPPAVAPPPPAPVVPPPAPPPAPIPVAVTTRWRSLRGLTTAITVLLVLTMAGAAFAVVAFALRIRALNDLIDGNLNLDTAQRARDADDLVGAATAITGLLILALFVLVIIWTFRAAKNNDALGRQYPRLKPGWAIAGWLIPLANAVIPILVLQDLWRGSERSTPRFDPSWRSNRGSALLGWFWAALIVSQIRFGFGTDTAHINDPSELRDLRGHDVTAIVGMVVTIVAAILAIQVFRKLCDRQEDTLRAQQDAWTVGHAPSSGV